MQSNCTLKSGPSLLDENDITSTTQLSDTQCLYATLVSICFLWSFVNLLIWPWHANIVFLLRNIAWFIPKVADTGHSSVYVWVWILKIIFAQFQELLQNGDDAGASKIKFILDPNEYSIDRLLNPQLAGFQVIKLPMKGMFLVKYIYPSQTKWVSEWVSEWVSSLSHSLTHSLT